MFYLIPSAVVAALGFMFWRVAFDLRRDRVRFARQHSQARFRYRPRNVYRFLFGRSFAVPGDPPEWQDRLVGSLRQLGSNPAIADQGKSDRPVRRRP